MQFVQIIHFFHIFKLLEKSIFNMGEKGELVDPPPPTRRKWFIPLLIVGCIALILVIVIPIVVSQQSHDNNKYVVGEAEAKALALKVLKEVPLVDG